MPVAEPVAGVRPEPRLQAFGTALLLEALLIAGGLTWVATHPPRRPPPVVPLTLEAPLTEPRPEPPKPSEPPPPPPPVRQAAPPRVAPQPVPVPQPVAPVPEPVVAAPAVAEAMAVPAPVTPPAPPPPPPAQPVADPRPEYSARVKAAVQAAVVYPPAAVSLNFNGRARAEFHLRDGTPGQARVTTSSGLGMVDRAALRAVESASYPAPPAALKGHDEVYQVWVEFNLR